MCRKYQTMVSYWQANSSRRRCLTKFNLLQSIRCNVWSTSWAHLRIMKICAHNCTFYSQSVTLFIAYITVISMHSHQIQHYTNQLARDTNKSLKELAHIPSSAVASEQVSWCCRAFVTILLIDDWLDRNKDACKRKGWPTNFPRLWRTFKWFSELQRKRKRRALYAPEPILVSTSVLLFIDLL